MDEPSVTPPCPDRRDGYRFAIGLALICLIAVALRATQVFESLWLDELHTSWCVSANWSDVSVRARMGNQFPLYFWLVRGVVQLFGQSELSLRLPSHVAGIALIVGVALIVRSWTESNIAAWLSALLVAIDHEFGFYAQEARVYSIIQVTGLIQVWSGWQLLQRGTIRWRLALIGSTIGLFLLHYTAGLLLLGEFCCLCLLYSVPSWRPNYSLRSLLLDAAIMAAACGLLTWPHLLEIYGRRDNWKAFVTPQPRSNMLRFTDVYGITSLLIGVLILGRNLLNRATVNWTLDRRLCCLLMLITVPMAVAWGLTYWGLLPIFFYRYLIVFSFVGPCVVGNLCGRLPRQFQVAAAMLVLMFAVVSCGRAENWWANGKFISERREDWRAAIERVGAEGDEIKVLLRSGFIEVNELGSAENPLLVEFLGSPVRGLYSLSNVDERLFIVPGRFSVVLLQQRQELRNTGVCWLLWRTSDAQSVESLQALLSSDPRFGTRDVQVFPSGSGLWILRVEFAANGI